MTLSQRSALSYRGMSPVHHPSAVALTSGDLSLIPAFGRVIIRSLALCRGAEHLYTARDATGALVGFTLVALPYGRDVGGFICGQSRHISLTVVGDP